MKECGEVPDLDDRQRAEYVREKRVERNEASLDMTEERIYQLNEGFDGTLISGSTLLVEKESPVLQVQSVVLNGETLNRNYITHDEIIAGGELKFIMGSDKSVWY